MTVKKSAPRRTKAAKKPTTRKKPAAAAKKGPATKKSTSRKKAAPQPAAAGRKQAAASRKAATRGKSAARKAGAGKPAAAKPAKAREARRTSTPAATGKAATARKATRAASPAHKSPSSPKKPAKAPAASAAPRTKKTTVRTVRIEEIRELPTQEIWVQYRRAVTAKKVDSERVEGIRNALMELHYPLVRHIAERLLQTLPRSIELDDLVSAGLFGLMDAIRGFDPDRGIKFKTYCTTRIRGSILDQLRSQDWVPRLVRLKAGKIEKALQRLQGEYGREPTHAELAASLEMEHGELSKEITNARAKTMFSLSERWDDGDEDGSLEKVEILEDKQAIDPVHELNRRDLLVYITRSLTHKERFIIEQYYQVGHTMREIGEMLALTESRVCQIHSNVMARLKGLLNPKESSLIS